MDRMVDVSCLLDARAEIGEGPIWDPSIRRVLWVDIPTGTLHSTRLTDGHDLVLDVGMSVGAVVPRQAGGWALAIGTGFRLLRFDGHVETDIDLGMGPDMRMNDGACDGRGRFLAGSMAHQADTPVGELMAMESDWSVRPVLTGSTISNGIGWTPDHRSMYYIDSPTLRVDVLDYDLDQGAATNRRPLFEFGDLPGQPDGLTVDNDGCVWVAVWGGSAVHRITPTGVLDQTIALPVSQVTKPAFVGEGGSVMVVTSARKGLDPSVLEREPLAGGVFVVDAGVSGPIGRPFAG